MAGGSPEDTAHLLGRVPVFESLGHGDLEKVAEVAIRRSFEAGEVIFREGDQSDTCYIVSAGRARATRVHGDGRTITLAQFGPGDIFGELAMFDEERRSATVEATDALEVVGILGPDMRRLLREHSDLAVGIVVALGRRLRAANDRLGNQSFQTVQSRVAGVLSDLVSRARDDGPVDGLDGGGVLVRATQAELAQLAGSSRESASRFLAVLERAGVIEQGRGRLIVRRPEALEGYVF
jgi:CRP/FNR family transcriptional regulator, cyclic AMP receptor protein